MMHSTTETVKTIEDAAINARRLEGDAIIKRNVLWAMGACVVPLPIVDMALATGVQIKMLRELSAVYGLPFRERLVRKLLSSLVVGVGGVGVGTMLAISLAKAIPGFGFAALTTPIFVGALTQAIGNVFMLHFETGGTFLDFDAVALREYFRREYAAAKDNLSKQRPSSAPHVPPPPVVTTATTVTTTAKPAV